MDDALDMGNVHAVGVEGARRVPPAGRGRGRRTAPCPTKRNSNFPGWSV